MGIALITGPANAGKAQVLMEAVRRHMAQGDEPLLVVPTRADQEHYAAELAGDGALLGGRIERFEGLLAEAVQRAGVTRPALGGIARGRLLAGLAAASGHEGPAGPGFLRALGEIVGELQMRRVSPERLREALSHWAAADGAGAASGAGLERVFESYRWALREMGRLDEEQRALAALDALRVTPRLWGSQPVLFYGFDDLTRIQLDAIETLGRHVGVAVTVSLAYEPGRVAFAGRAASFQALRPLAQEHRALGPRADYYAPGSRASLSHLERSLFEPEGTRVDPAGAVRLLEGGGERAELELVAGEIRGLLESGMPAEEIAVVIRSLPAGLDLLEEVFAAAGVPCALQRRRRFADTGSGGALIGLLRCVPDASAPGADGGPAQARDLLAWLRAPGLLERPELADRLEQRARRAGVASAAGARRLWEERNWPLETIDRLAQTAMARSPGVALIDAATRELDRIFAAPRRGRAEVLSPDQLDEARALAAARRALSELRELARLAPELAPRRAGELAQALADVEFTSGQAPGPGAVAVLDPLGLRARRVRALFVCGLQEGVFPAPGRPRPYLAEEERRRLAETSGLRLGEPEDPLAAERYLLYAAVSRPEEILYLSWHLADDEGAPSARSLFLDDVLDLYDHALLDGRATRALGTVAAGEGVARPPVAEAGLRRLGDPDLLEALRARPWSASSLEGWIRCPARWFIDRLLDPADFDPEPEPLARGSLAHEALRDTLEGLREETGSARLTPARLARARALLAQALARLEAERPLTVAPERLAAARRRLRFDLERYLEHAAEHESELEPAHLETGFGMTQEPGPGELPPLSLGAGMTLRGRIDRVDIGPQGQAVVYDYKNRNITPPGRWVQDGSIQVALYIQAVRELLGVRVVGGFYQPLSGDDLRARGLLEDESGLDLGCVRGDMREPDEVQEILAQALELARTAAAEAGAGAIESRPMSCGWRGSGCVYPTICRCER
jgi:ATP-dependent helicase/DNAse subunit B